MSLTGRAQWGEALPRACSASPSCARSPAPGTATQRCPTCPLGTRRWPPRREAALPSSSSAPNSARPVQVPRGSWLQALGRLGLVVPIAKRGPACAPGWRHSPPSGARRGRSAAWPAPARAKKAAGLMLAERGERVLARRPCAAASARVTGATSKSRRIRCPGATCRHPHAGVCARRGASSSLPGCELSCAGARRQTTACRPRGARLRFPRPCDGCPRPSSRSARYC